jgi:hypothetical protein
LDCLNNAELFNLIRDQSEHLGSMLREQQIEASRSRASSKRWQMACWSPMRRAG